MTGASRVINRPGSGGVSNAGSFAYWSWATDAVYNPADAALARGTAPHRLPRDDQSRRRAARCGGGLRSVQSVRSARASTAALDYVYRTLVEEINISQHVVAANVQAQCSELWAGPLAVAAGVEYRRDTTSMVHDPLSNVFAYFQNFGADYNGEAGCDRRLPRGRSALC